MATITTTTNASPLAYPGNTRVDTEMIGAGVARLYALVKTSTADTFQLFYSDSPWAAWTARTSDVRANVVDAGSIFVTNDHYLYWCYRTNEASQDRIYLRRMYLPAGVWSAEILVAVVGNGGVAGSIYGGMDLQVVVSAGQVFAAIAIGTTATSGVQVLGVYFNNAGVPGVNHLMVSGTHGWSYPGTGRVGPSIDIEHQGDGKSSGAPHLWVAFGRDRLMIVKCAWNGGGWSGPTQAQELIGPGMAAREYTAARWTGNEFCVAVPNAVTTDTVLLVERDRANSSTVIRQTPLHPTGVIRHTSLSYNWVTRDVRVYAIGTSTTVLYYTDYVRATGVWTSWATVVATAVLGSTGQEWGVRRGSWSDAKHDVYTAHAGAPNTIVHTAQSLTYAPFTPTWAVTSGQPYDVAATLLLDWNFADSDPGDTQSAYAISRQIGAGAVSYFRASDATWQPAEVQNTSGTTARTLAAAWGAGTDAPHTYKVKVWDQSSTASGYSDALVVIASTLVNPAITSPAPAAVLTGDSVTVTWTAAEQTAYRVTLSITAGGQLYDSGWVAGGVLTKTVPYTLLNGGAYTVTVQTANNEGLPSAIQSRNVTVSFLAPDTATLVATPVPASGWIAVAVTNPAPSGGRPAVASNDVYRRGSTVGSLNPNPTFETALTGWNGVNAALTRVNTQAHTGSWSCRVVPNGVSSDIYAEFASQIIDPLLDYTADGWIRLDTALKPGRIFLHWYTAAGVYISSTSAAVPAVAGVWLWGQVTGTPPGTAGKVAVAMGVGSTPAATDAAYVDDVYLRPANASAGVRVATGLAAGATHNDWKAVGGVPYEYRVLTVAVNGTSTFGPWTT
jgi:hypothetical protein